MHTRSLRQARLEVYIAYTQKHTHSIHENTHAQAGHLIELLLSLPSMSVSASALVVLVPSLGQIARARPAKLMDKILPELLGLATNMPEGYNTSQVCYHRKET